MGVYFKPPMLESKIQNIYKLDTEYGSVDGYLQLFSCRRHPQVSGVALPAGRNYWPGGCGNDGIVSTVVAGSSLPETSKATRAPATAAPMPATIIVDFLKKPP